MSASFEDTYPDAKSKDEKSKDEKSKDEKSKLEHKFHQELAALWEPDNEVQEHFDDSEKELSCYLPEIQPSFVQAPLLELSEYFVLLNACLIEDYTRIGRHDIVNVIHKFSEQQEYTSVFQFAYKKYYSAESENIDYGLILVEFYLCFRSGHEKEEEEVRKIIQNFMKHGFIPGRCLLAIALDSGTGFPEDPKTAQDILRADTGAEQKEFYTPYIILGRQLANIHMNVNPSPKLIKESIALLEIAATNKMSAAIALLAMCYFDLAENHAEISNYCAKAFFHATLANRAKQKWCLQRGSYILALCHLAGFGTPTNYNLYLSLMKRSFEFGFCGAAKKLAFAYAEGIPGFLVPDPKQSLIFAFQNVRLEVNISFLLNGYKPYFSKYQDNIKLLETIQGLFLQLFKGCILSDPRDADIVSSMYKEGLCVPKDLKKAALCQSRFGKKEHPVNRNNLALLAVEADEAEFYQPFPAALPPTEIYFFMTYVTDPKVEAGLKKIEKSCTPLFNIIYKHWNWSGKESAKRNEKSAQKDKDEEGVVPKDIARIVADYAYGQFKPSAPAKP